MSDFNEELLNDDTDDFPDIGEAEEDALLQDDDDGDVLNLVPEEELGETLESDQKHSADEVKKNSRQDKFATERKRITAPESSDNERPNNNRFGKQNNRIIRGIGGKYQQQQGRFQQFNQGRQYNNHVIPPGRNKTVLINPRFQGVVHVNNNARLAWDTQQQQFQPNPWVSGVPPNNMGPPTNMGPPMQPLQVMQSHPQMQAMQGPPQMQFQPQMQQFQGPPQMQAVQRPMHMQPIPQGPPMQNMGPPGQQMPYAQPQQGFLPQPLPPGVPQSSMQPPNLPAPSSYWDGQNQVTSIPQGPNQQLMPYMQNNYESLQPIVINTSQPPPQIPNSNYQYNNQFNNGPPMQHHQNPHMHQNFLQPNRDIFANNMHPPQGNMGPNKKDMFLPKRKVAMATFGQNKKRFVQARLGSVEQSQIKIKNFTVKTEDRPSVVKEVTVTNVTTVKIEEDEQTRDLRLKIEEQRRKREQVLQWKELRRRQEKGKGGLQQQNRVSQQNLGGSVRTPVLQPIKQIDEQKQIRGRIRNQKTDQNVEQRVIIAPVVAKPAVLVEEPVVELDKKHLSTFLADRKVLVKDEALMATRKVVINNISTSTADRKIFQICKGIGEVQKLHRDKNDRHATITFKSVASAHAFFKKYQRHMLDLSMIEVSLTPESDGQD